MMEEHTIKEVLIDEIRSDRFREIISGILDEVLEERGLLLDSEIT
jgi:hypothetical protein